MLMNDGASFGSPTRVDMPDISSWVHTSPIREDYGTAWVQEPVGGWGRPSRPVIPDENTPKRRFGKRIIRDVPVGMNELKGLVLDMRRDIKRIHGAQSIEGARSFVDKNPGQGYAAFEEDLNNDGIPEVFVKKGDDYILINGYTTSQSDWARRQRYYSTHPDRASRKENSMKDWLRDDVMQVRYDDEDPRKLRHAREPDWNAAARQYGYKVTNTPKDRSSYQIYVSQVFKPLWQQLLTHLQHDENYDIIKKSYLKVAARAWNLLMVSPVLEEYIQDDATFRPIRALLENRKHGSKQELKMLTSSIKHPVIQERLFARVRDQIFTIRTGEPGEVQPLITELDRTLADTLRQ